MVGDVPPDEDTTVDMQPKRQVHVQFDPFVNDNADQNVNAGIYAQQTTQSGTTGPVIHSDEDDDYNYPNSGSGKDYYQGGPSGGSGDPFWWFSG